MLNYLQRRNATYYYRRVVPLDVRPTIGREHWTFSLGTKDASEASAKARLQAVEHDRLIAHARAAKASPEAPKAPAADISREEWEFLQEQAELASDDLYALDEKAEALDAFLAGNPEMAKLIEADKKDDVAFAVMQEQNRRASVKQNQAVEQASVLVKGKGIYLDTDIIDGWAKESKPSARGKDAYWRDAKLFNSMMGRKSVELITKADVMAYKLKLIDDPKRSQINVRDRLAYLRTLLKWAAGADIITDNPAQDVRMAVKERGGEREDFTTDDLNALFSGPVYSKGERPKGYAGGEAAYWIPLLALFMGARREEIGQLRVADVKLEPYFDDNEQRQEAWCIHITDTPDDSQLANQIKNKGSRRLVPLHPVLIELGFIRYVEKLDKAGRVFPALKPIGIGQRLTDKWGQWYKTYRDACGVTSETKVFHSFRHTWKTHAVDAGIPERVCRQFQGHEGKDSADKYGKAAPAMRVMVAAIWSFRVPGLKLPAPPSENQHTDTQERA